MAEARAKPDLRVYVILDPGMSGGRELATVARLAIAGGATALQVRAKSATTRELLGIVESVIGATAGSGVPVIVNDRLDVALAAGADGVHVGDTDMPVLHARRLLDAGCLVGASAGGPDEAAKAEAEGADYLGTGDVYGTTSKPDADRPIGLPGLRAVVEATGLPVVGIGGISALNAAAVVRAGAAGVAVISAVVAADDVTAAAAALRHAVDGARDAAP